MAHTMTPGTRGWRHIERYAYVERPYDEVWVWLAGHLSTLGDPLPDGGRAVDLHIRPGGIDVARPVRLHVGGVICGDARARAALEWTDAARPHLFPQLEGTLEIAPVPSDAAPFTQVGIVARYRPPLGALGAIGDRLVGADVTDAALTTLLDELCAAVEKDVVPPSLEPDAEAVAPTNPSNEQDEDPDVRRTLVAVDGLAVRPGGATGVCETLAALPGIVHVSLNPFSGLATVDHDTTLCSLEQVLDALESDVSQEPD